MKTEFLDFISSKKIFRIVEDIREISLNSPYSGQIPAFSEVEDQVFFYIKEFFINLNNSYSYRNRNLDIYEDAIGNIYVTLDSDKEHFVAYGSSIDGNIVEGDFGGILAVASSMELFRVFFEHDIEAKAGFVLIVFRAGRNLPCNYPNLGGKLASGLISKEDLEKITYFAENKMFLRDYLISRGFDWQKILNLLEAPTTTTHEYRYFLELSFGGEEILGKTKLAVLNPDFNPENQEIAEKIGKIHAALFQDKVTFLSGDLSGEAKNMAEAGIPSGQIFSLLPSDFFDNQSWKNLLKAVQFLASSLLHLANR